MPQSKQASWDANSSSNDQTDIGSRMQLYHMGTVTQNSCLSAIKQKELARHLILPTLRPAHPNDNGSILTLLKIIDAEEVKWIPVAEGGFSAISVAAVKVIHVNSNNDICSTTDQKQQPK